MRIKLSKLSPKDRLTRERYARNIKEVLHLMEGHELTTSQYREQIQTIFDGRDQHLGELEGSRLNGWREVMHMRVDSISPADVLHTAIWMTAITSNLILQHCDSLELRKEFTRLLHVELDRTLDAEAEQLRGASDED